MNPELQRALHGRYRELQAQWRREDEALIAQALTSTSTPILPPAVRPFIGRPLWALAGLVASAALAVLVLRPTLGSLNPPVVPQNTLVAKSYAHDRLLVGVEADGIQRRLAPHDHIEAGARVGLFHTSPEAGYLGAFYVDADGVVTTLYPLDGPMLAAFEPGSERRIPDGALLTPGTGCAWFVGVFATTSLGLDEVEQQLRGAERIDKGCTLRVRVEGSRTVSIMPARR